jgi:hypothetical protein
MMLIVVQKCLAPGGRSSRESGRLVICTLASKAKMSTADLAIDCVRNDRFRKAEITVPVQTLNRMLAFGRSVSVRIA